MQRYEKGAISLISQHKTVLIAGSTGDLGGRIARALVDESANVRALIRRGTPLDKIVSLEQLGITIVEVDYHNATEMKEACLDVSCVVSALSGLEEVIIETQTLLLQAAVSAGVPRFIPSDYSMDYTKLPVGSNRNLELRRDFMKILDQAPITATSILNGAFADMLTGMAPIVLFSHQRILYWDDADQPMDFTTKDNVATFTAKAALDDHTPRFLSIAGDQISARQLSVLMSSLTGQRFRLLQAGSRNFLSTLIKIARMFSKSTNDLYPAWQGMQYVHGMFSGLGKLEQIHNDRYSGIQWTSAKQILVDHIRSSN